MIVWLAIQTGRVVIGGAKAALFGWRRIRGRCVTCGDLPPHSWFRPDCIYCGAAKQAIYEVRGVRV